MYISIVISCLALFTLVFLVKSRSLLRELEAEDQDIEKVYAPASESERLLSDTVSNYQELRESYKQDLLSLKQGETKLALYHLGVGTSDSVSYMQISQSRDLAELERNLADTKVRIKALVSNKQACICSMGSDVTVNGKKSEAKKLFNREIKLRLRCLDNEFKAAAAVVDWNNINRLIERAQKTFEEINSSSDLVKTHLTSQYLGLKITELRLGYEITQLKQTLKEEERQEIQIEREAAREEKRIKAAAEKAERERKVMERLVTEELKKLESSSEEQKALYELHKEELEKLRNKEKRAVSLAQQTRAGYVYVISNKLSFGEGVVKIGMTRRADPNDRVKELGDASVPELFDVHAFAFTEDAPTFERFLHSCFANQRVNLVNGRKEFFFASADEVLSEMKYYDGEYELSE
ncbi:GIY-YIG nuclease family protein [Vibrio superstes]|uniref:Bacteriophage T5 Orf172 DNA-binding domain-containing protein n=1 Tax=Vibrio superstes NBRC 103154 TaxID=1219062 RepID=A0A511QNH4_9VIBR|nr:DUF4041 domain-containing protein [Vibrio superstes]GEM78496.1 hypothetical protein VSU01S_07410 [Vibrio superstes NBRC 103154]